MNIFSKECVENMTGACEPALDVPGNQPAAANVGIRAHVPIPLAMIKNWEEGGRQTGVPAAANLYVIAKRPREGAGSADALR